MSFPITLADTAIVVPFGQKVTGSSANLKNPFRTGMRVTEIRFRITSMNGTDTAIISAVAGLRCRFNVGKIPISDYVHLWNFDKVIDSTYVFNPALSGTTYALSNGGIDIIAVWRPITPIYVPQGGFLEPQFFNTGENSGTGSFTVNIIYLAYPTKELPRSVTYPWICSWVGDSVLLNADATDQSDRTDLRNPFDEPIKVKKLIFRNWHNSLAYETSATLQWALLRLTDHNGLAIVRDRTPIGVVVNHTDFSWNLSGTIAPNGYWIARLDELFSNINQSVNWRPYLSLVGEREVRL